MRLCAKGHQIPQWAQGECPQCAQERRNSWQRGKPKRFDPGRYLGKGTGPGAHTLSERTPRSSDNPRPAASSRKKPKPQTSAKPRIVPQAPSKAELQQAASPKPNRATTFTSQRVLEGIEQLIDLVSEQEMSLESLLAQVAVQPQKMAVLRDGRHAFVRVVREQWFVLFKAILQREEARVLVRKVGLDGLTPATTMNELAERCQMSVDEMQQYGKVGLRKLREFTNRQAVMACVVNSARQYLR